MENEHEQEQEKTTNEETTEISIWGLMWKMHPSYPNPPAEYEPAPGYHAREPRETCYVCGSPNIYTKWVACKVKGNEDFDDKYEYCRDTTCEGHKKPRWLEMDSVEF